MERLPTLVIHLNITNYRGQFCMKPDGLLKKTLSVEVGGRKWHIIRCIDNQMNQICDLSTPDKSPELDTPDLFVELKRALVGKRKYDEAIGSK